MADGGPTSASTHRAARRPELRSRRRPSRGRWWRRIRRTLLVVTIIVTCTLTGALVYLAALPGVGDAEARAHRILAANGSADAGVVPSSKVAQAMVAVEDERFYSHHGIDLLGVARSVIRRVTDDGEDPGGSTITQQLARRLYGGGTLQQVGLAVKLEAQYSKREILEMYLNVAYYGANQWGATAAAHAFFSKAPAALDWAEASLLAGLVQAPSSYDPIHHFVLARIRQHHVLDRLVATHILSAHAANLAYRELTTLHD